MKNAYVVSRMPTLRFPIPNAPPLQGWAIRLLDDIPEGGCKKGYWMGHWSEVQNHVDFGFEPELSMAFIKEADARRICDELRTTTELETEVIKIGK